MQVSENEALRRPSFFITCSPSFHLLLSRKIPGWKQRIAGKSLPMEKFCIRKAERFLQQGNTLVLPVVELIYAWNGFTILEKQFKLVEKLYVLTEKILRRLQRNKGTRGKYCKRSQTLS